jgi:hypothetical protein
MGFVINLRLILLINRISFQTSDVTSENFWRKKDFIRVGAPDAVFE